MKKQRHLIFIVLAITAIIGVLTGIVLLSLSGKKARITRDAEIISDLTQIRTIGQKIFSADANYSSVVSNTDISALIGDIKDQGGVNILRTGNLISYCVEVKLPGGKWGCVNSGLTAVFNLSVNPACDGAVNDKATNTYCR